MTRVGIRPTPSCKIKDFDCDKALETGAPIEPPVFRWPAAPMIILRSFIASRKRPTTRGEPTLNQRLRGPTKPQNRSLVDVLVVVTGIVLDLVR
jgi:hypothetical protein